MAREGISNDPEILRELLNSLLRAFEQAIHSRDCALQVAQTVPDWKSRMREARDNSLRQQHTEEFLADVRKLYAAGQGASLSDQEIAAIRARLARKPY